MCIVWLPSVPADTGVSSAPAAMLLSAGTRLGSFEIVSVLGSGGMGEVYRARDTRLDRTVAVKILRPDKGTSRERFFQEARGISRDASALGRLPKPGHAQDATG